MEWEPSDKVIIVEGVSDKKRVQPVLNQNVEIKCTNGTISQDKLDQLVEEFEEREVYIFFDADDSGEKITKADLSGNCQMQNISILIKCIEKLRVHPYIILLPCY